MNLFKVFVTVIWLFVEVMLIAGMRELSSFEYYAIGGMSMFAMYVWWKVEMEEC